MYFCFYQLSCAVTEIHFSSSQTCNEVSATRKKFAVPMKILVKSFKTFSERELLKNAVELCVDKKVFND